MEVLVITGMSGGGKTEALRSLEDLGFFCVDNLPVPLLGRFVDLLAGSGEAGRVALVVDVRAGEFIAEAASRFASIEAAGYRLQVVFLDASDEVLLRRFSESRRRHPLDTGDLRAGLATERERLVEMRGLSAQVIDTSELTVHELRRRLRQQFASVKAELSVSIVSFGFKYGVPVEADLMFDVRFLPNPYFVDELRPLSGIDGRVRDYVIDQDETGEFLDRVGSLLAFLLPQYRREGKAYLTVAVGCTGGRHRSVAVAHALQSRLESEVASVAVRHRDMERKQ